MPLLPDSPMAPDRFPALDAAELRHASEARRLVALQAQLLMDTPPEPGLDALVRLAARALDVPMVALGLVDADRCWLKANLGLPIDELDRAPSVAARIVERALAGDTAPLVISDLSRDPGFAAHPLAQDEPGEGKATLQFAAGAPVVDAQGEALGAVVVFDTRLRPFDAAQRSLLADLALLASGQLQARHQARQVPAADGSDPLTGAASSTPFFQLLEVELRHAMRSGEPFAVLRLDLDGLRDINTAYGPAVGDRVLREIAQRLRAQVRLGDLLARLGDDDFGIVMRHGGAEEAAVLVERIQAALREPVYLGEGLPSLGAVVSVGLAVYSDQVASVGELLEQADMSLQLAKGRKQSRWQVFGRFFEGTLGRRLAEKDRP